MADRRYSPNMNPIIFETNFWKVILNTDDQTYLGRSFVSAKRRETGSMSDLTTEEWLDFGSVVKKLEAACTKAFGATMFNWTCLMNLAYQNDPPDPHVHWHFRPRYKQAVQFAGETFEDAAFGSHYQRGTERKVSDGVAGRIVEAIRAAL